MNKSSTTDNNVIKKSPEFLKRLHASLDAETGSEDEAIKQIFWDMEERHDLSWTELAVMTAKEYAGRYREWIAQHIYESACEMAGARAWKWSSLPESQKVEWRKRADEAANRRST